MRAYSSRGLHSERRAAILTSGGENILHPKGNPHRPRPPARLPPRSLLAVRTTDSPGRGCSWKQRHGVVAFSVRLPSVGSVSLGLPGVAECLLHLCFLWPTNISRTERGLCALSPSRDGRSGCFHSLATRNGEHWGQSLTRARFPFLWGYASWRHYWPLGDSACDILKNRRTPACPACPGHPART